MALVGLALAILFTWNLLRTPSGPQRRQPERQSPIPSSSGLSTYSNANFTSAEDSRVHNVIDELFQPIKVTCFYSHLSCKLLDSYLTRV